MALVAGPDVPRFRCVCRPSRLDCICCGQSALETKLVSSRVIPKFGETAPASFVPTVATSQPSTARRPPAVSNLRSFHPPLSARTYSFGAPDLTPRVHFSKVVVPEQVPTCPQVSRPANTIYAVSLAPSLARDQVPTAQPPRSRTVSDHNCFLSPRSFRSPFVGERIASPRLDFAQPARIVPPQQPRTVQYAVSDPTPVARLPNVGAMCADGWAQCEVGPRSGLPKVHPLFNVRGTVTDKCWAFAYLKLNGWVLHLWASELASKSATMAPDGWFDIRSCRAVDSYQTVEIDRSIYTNAVVCIFARGRLEFRTKTTSESGAWIDLIRRVQFESQGEGDTALDVYEPRIQQLENLLGEVILCHKRQTTTNVYGRIFDLYDDGIGLSLPRITTMLREFLEIRKRRLDAYVSLQYRILHSHARQGSNGGSLFALFEQKANALTNKYRERSSLGSEAVRIHTCCDGDRNGRVDKTEFMQTAALVIFTEQDMQEEIEVRRLGFLAGQDNCLLQ